MENLDSPTDSSPILEILGGMYVQMLRIYDLLALSLKDNPGLDRLIELHESGRVLSPEPALILDEDET